MAQSISTNGQIITLTKKQAKNVNDFKSVIKDIEDSAPLFARTNTFQVLPVHNNTFHNLKCLTNELTSIE